MNEKWRPSQNKAAIEMFKASQQLKWIKNAQLKNDDESREMFDNIVKRASTFEELASALYDVALEAKNATYFAIDRDGFNDRFNINIFSPDYYGTGYNDLVMVCDILKIRNRDVRDHLKDYCLDEDIDYPVFAYDRKKDAEYVLENVLKPLLVMQALVNSN